MLFQSWLQSAKTSHVQADICLAEQANSFHNRWATRQQQIHVQRKEPKNKYQHSYLHSSNTILTSWQCRGQSYTPTTLPSKAVQGGNPSSSPMLYSHKAPPFYSGGKRMLHWRWQCSIVSGRRVGCLNLCYCRNRALMSPRTPQKCRGTHPRSPSLLFPSIHLCSNTSRPRCLARTTGISSHCLEV